MNVYFLQAGDHGPIKIGCAQDVLDRRIELQCAHYEKLHVRAIYPGDVALEQKFHAQFREHLIRGEWFAPAPEIMKCIDRAPIHHVDERPNGRPKIDREISLDEARELWLDTSLSNEAALEAMRGWTQSAAYREFGASGRPRPGRPPGDE